MANNSDDSQALAIPPVTVVPSRQSSGGQRSGRAKAHGLPDGWTAEIKPRSNDTYPGVVDRYYFEPGTNRRFRSLKAVKRHLEPNLGVDDTSENIRVTHGESNIDESKASPSSIAIARRRRRGCECFKFRDRPTSVTLVSTTGKNEWDPFVGDIRVQEKIRRFWEETFDAISCPNSA